jgi:hypothetical protein
MTVNEKAPTEPWYTSSPKNLALCALVWLGELFLLLMLLKWMFRASASDLPSTSANNHFAPRNLLPIAHFQR